MIERVCVLGLGYIGLPTSAVLATAGFAVLGVDTESSVVETLRRGELHIEEPGLRTLLEAAQRSGRLTIADCPEPADAFLICVPTPLTVEKTADLSCVISASESIIPQLREGNLVVIESTIPPGTTRDVVAPILERSGLSAFGTGASFSLVHCPERVIPGQVVREIISNDRVLGGLDRKSAEQARTLYSTFVEGELHLTDATTAEVVKLSENTFRDVNIALANELSNLCKRVGVNVWDAIELANHHPRVNLHQPGPGVGGHCLSIDPWFLVEKAPEITQMVRLSRNINDGQPRLVAEEAMVLLRDVLNPVVVLLGLAYKGNVGDVRESPAATIREALRQEGCCVRTVDPHVEVPDHDVSNPKEAFRGADLVILVTEHREFRSLEPAEVGQGMRNRRLYDARNFLDHKQWIVNGFVVRILGDGTK